MDNLDHIIKQLQECTAELKAGNDRAEWETQEREKLERAMKINEWTWKGARAVVRDYANNTIALYSGKERIL